MPEKGSLIGKGSSRNYKFNKSDSTRIIEWLNTNTAVNWVVYEEGDYTNIEAKLIQSARPLLNIAKNEYALPELKDLRAKCVKIAKQQY